MGKITVPTDAPVNISSEYVKYDTKGPFWKYEPDAEAEVHFAERGIASESGTPMMTLIETFAIAAKKKPLKVALRTEGLPALKKGENVPIPRPLSKWKQWTWKQYYSDCRKIAKGLLSLGFKQHDSINIFGFNSPEWFIAQMAGIIAGGKAAGIYPSDNAEQVQYKSFHSNGSVAFVENESCLDKFKAVIEDLPYLKAVVCWACDAGEDIIRSDGTVVQTVGFLDLLNLGSEISEKELDQRIALVRPGHCCAIIYTSGTTGKPKAVMISHDNLAFSANSVLNSVSGIGEHAEEERILSYLPLSHIAGMMIDIISPIVVTAYKKGWMSTNFARSYDLKMGTIKFRLQSVEPTLFLGVPRVWEKIAEKLQAIGAATGGFKKVLATAAKKRALSATRELQLGGNGKRSSMYPVFNVLLKKIKSQLGLDKCKFAFAGAAPMMTDTLKYFGSIGITINEVYGMSECTGATTLSTNTCHKWGTVGFEMKGCEVKVFKTLENGTLKECPRAKKALNPTEEEQGQICFRGRHVMIGYMANPALGPEHVDEIRKKNEEAISKDGWLLSGDKGSLSSEGMIKITGRYKELIITAGGENVAPVPIEDNIKKLCNEVSNIMMIGDRRKFNVCIITLKCKGATGELPGTKELDGDASKWGNSIKEASNNAAFIEYLSQMIKKTNKNGDVCPSSASMVQKFSILPRDFSVDTGELTATLKLKRSVVYDKYLDIIDAMYESDSMFLSYDAAGDF